MVRYLFYTIGDLTYQSPLVRTNQCCIISQKSKDLFYTSLKSQGVMLYMSCKVASLPQHYSVEVNPLVTTEADWSQLMFPVL